MADEQKPTVYEPTVAESRLLEVLLNPDYRNKSITEICNLADVSRNLYYDAFRKTGFAEYYASESKNIVKQVIGPVVNSFVKEALKGSYNHGKVILEMAGLYTERKEIKHEGSIDLTELVDDEPGSE